MVNNYPDTLNQTVLFQRLKSMQDDTIFSNATQIQIRKSISLVEQISADAVQIMKITPNHFPEYTLHDETHLLGVANLMGKIIIESDSLANLSYIEITILLLSAYLHDIGMAPSSKEIDEIIHSQEFRLYKENRLLDHEGFKEIVELLSNGKMEDREKNQLKNKQIEIEKSILTEYLRQNHGKAGFDFIIQKWSNDPRWIIEDFNITEITAWVCLGHTLDSKQIEFEFSDEFPFDKMIGQNKINIRYCAILLRLADILDFDRKRTPKILYENISPKNEVSLQEWNKHIAITGWSISKDRIIFEAECTHPVYEKALRTFLDVIDRELQDCKSIVYNFPARDDISEKYRLHLPNSVDRSKIVAKGNTYSYMDLSFSLSHEEIMKLLMGADFWGGTSLCIRELIQNGYDAIRHRRAVEKAQGNDWNDGKITLIQRLNKDGCLEFECIDNGMGMNRHILQDYFFNVGRSYYRSPEFEQIRNGWKQKNVDFDPVSHFGIGIISSFLIGDKLKIITQRYRGPYHECDEQLEVKVDGFSRLVVVKKNVAEPRPGTRIIITGKKIPINEVSEYWLDPLNLLGATQFYAAALDIPIEVIVEPPFNEYKGVIPPVQRPLRLKTEFEFDSKIPSNYFTIVERNFSSMKHGCEGTARIFFLIDKFGKICINNEWGQIILDENYNKEDPQKFYNVVKNSNNDKINKHHWCRSLLAQDGILVSLDDVKRDIRLYHSGARYPSPHFSFLGSYFINLSGKAKLPLKPNRAPYQTNYFHRTREEEKWAEFVRELNKFISSGIVDIVENDRLKPDPRTLWDIIDIYNFSLDGLDKNWSYSHIPIPFATEDRSSLTEWNTLQQLHFERDRYITINADHPLDPKIKNISTNGINLSLCSDNKIIYELLKVVRANTILNLINQHVCYELSPDINEFVRLDDTQYVEDFYSGLDMQVYSNDLNNYLSINNPAKSANFNHPVIQFLLDTRKSTVEQYKWFKWGVLIIASKIANDQDFDEKLPELWNKDTVHNVSTAVGHLSKVNWNIIPKTVRPPFKIFYPNSGNTHEITLDYLMEKITQTGYKLKEEKPQMSDLS